MTSFKRTYARTFVLSAPDPVKSTFTPCLWWRFLDTHRQVWLSLFVGSLLSTGSSYTQDFVCALQGSVSPVLCKFCNQITLAFNVRFPRCSQFLCQIPRLGNLLWALELLQQCKKFLGIITSSLWVVCSVLCGGAHMPCLSGLLQPEPLSPWQATADLCLHRRHSNTQRQVWLGLREHS